MDNLVRAPYIGTMLLARHNISYILVFMPEHLCDYIIYHELAHLTEMNHGERFHTLLNQYLEGREATLSKELQRYSWPVFRK